MPDTNGVSHKHLKLSGLNSQALLSNYGRQAVGGGLLFTITEAKRYLGINLKDIQVLMETI